MIRLVSALLLLLLLAAPASGAEVIGSGIISSQTTTTAIAAVAGETIAIMSASFCVDAGGATTGITIRSSTPTNLIGTSVVYAVGAGSCLVFPRSGGKPWGSIAVAGTSLQIVTTVGNGPVNYYIEAVQQ